MRSLRRAIALALAAPLVFAGSAPAQAPELVDRDLAVRVAASGLEQPVSMAFLGRNEMLVLEKASGKVKRVVGGQVTDVVLDVAVNSASERGLLGIALHPRFRSNGFVYLFWSESRTGADSTNLDGVRLLGNRVDRYEWDGQRLEFDRAIARFRAFQADANQPLRGNHDGGVLRFGPDGKLYVIVGDTGRRGQLQNLADGPFGPGNSDDQFGGPEPDDAHLTGLILRLNDDGSAPRDNPFFRTGRSMGGEVGANIQKLYAYGLRNSFGMAFDPRSGDLWEQENGDDSYSELNRVEPGMNSGWVQIMGRPRGSATSARSRRIRPRRSRSRRTATSVSSRFAGHRPISRPRRRRRWSGCSCSPARASVIPSSAGASRWRRAASASSTARRSAASTAATCSWPARATSWRAATCSGSS